MKLLLLGFYIACGCALWAQAPDSPKLLPFDWVPGSGEPPMSLDTAYRHALRVLGAQRPPQKQWLLDVVSIQGVLAKRPGGRRYDTFTFIFSRENAREQCAVDVPMGAANIPTMLNGISVRSMPTPK